MQWWLRAKRRNVAEITLLSLVCMSQGKKWETLNCRNYKGENSPVELGTIQIRTKDMFFLALYTLKCICQKR